MTTPKSYPTQPLGLTGWSHPTAPLEVEITYVDTDADSHTLNYEAHFRVKAVTTAEAWSKSRHGDYIRYTTY